MLGTPFHDAITAAREELRIEIVTTDLQLDEAQRLRYRVYCQERGFEPGQDGRETDAFDRHARHVLVRSTVTGEALGTVRLVIPTAGSDQAAFPMNRVCEPYVLAPLPAATTGEISRFALTRERRGISSAAAALMRLSLMRGIVFVSGTSGLTHWCAIMEQSLLRLLRATAIHFEAVGPAVEYHGMRQPTVASIESILNRMRLQQPAVWSYVTGNGGMWSTEIAAVARSA